MGGVKWRLLHGVDQKRLSEARAQAHYAAQWLARAARAYIPARIDDSHTNLGWDDALGGLTTHAFPAGTRLGLKIADLTLLLLDSGRIDGPDALPLDGQRDADARAWLGERLSAIGLDPRALDTQLPYEMPAHPIASGAAYAVTNLDEPLSELSTWHSNAHAMLNAMRQEIAAQKLDAPPVRCWPHHFDLDTLISVRADHTMGVGFSPGDGYYDEPYFYVSMYPHPDVVTLPGLPAIGHWHTKDFHAAVAPAHRILKARGQESALLAFFSVSINAAIRALS